MEEENSEPRDTKWKQYRRFQDRIEHYVLPDVEAFQEKDSWRSGFLVWNVPTKTFSAYSLPFNYKFTQLAKGNYLDLEESPLDTDESPKSFFLMLLASRGFGVEGIPTHSPNVARRWRQYAIARELVELERDLEAPLSEDYKRTRLSMADNETEFNRYVGEKLTEMLRGSTASADFRCVAQWIGRIEHLEKEGIPAAYQAFFRSVEEAAGKALARGDYPPLPTKKAVRDIFVGTSLGTDKSFGDICKLLRFNWLPWDRPGPRRS
ncbi:hypothetical protein OJ996_25155 [Luteolibacter sp. GHJ8]|uniref:Uncharacterized protein n=1 Tax=Luteolibacter rhizosphaerae TaxID=2989719 RepID=A0ABT3GAN5_9BACT|nr:hypothetical protein [Luteolibacter rhizosphaerae]MCW1916901.1 hypothetical protein [Luteolibacter rhizosphaerae]